jgi:hypothetical protein
LPNLDAWLRSILWDSKLPTLDHGNPVKDDDHGSIEVHRLKARLPLSNGEVKIVQGVREVFEILDLPESSNSKVDVTSRTTGKIVFIGRRIIDIPFEKSFLDTIGS